MPDGDAKGARVTGFFVALIGAGVILDSRADALGSLIALGGTAVLVWGLLHRGTPTESSEQC